MHAQPTFFSLLSICPSNRLTSVEPIPSHTNKNKQKGPLSLAHHPVALPRLRPFSICACSLGRPPVGWPLRRSSPFIQPPDPTYPTVDRQDKDKDKNKTRSAASSRIPAELCFCSRNMHCRSYMMHDTYKTESHSHRARLGLPFTSQLGLDWIGLHWIRWKNQQ